MGSTTSGWLLPVLTPCWLHVDHLGLPLQVGGLKAMIIPHCAALNRLPVAMKGLFLSLMNMLPSNTHTLSTAHPTPRLSMTILSGCRKGLRAGHGISVELSHHKWSCKHLKLKALESRQLTLSLCLASFVLNCIPYCTSILHCTCEPFQVCFL